MTYLATEDAGCLPAASQNEPGNKGTRSLGSPRQERVRHVLYGSLEGIDRTIKILHHLRYADPNDWSDPIPVPSSGAGMTGKPDQWMVIMTKILLIE